jgi:hypothetical protein
MGFDKLWVAAALLVIALPIVSAISAPFKGGNFPIRWLRAMGSYSIVFCLVYCGYIFQGVTEISMQGGYFNSFQENTFSFKMKAIAVFLLQQQMLSELLIISSVVTCVLLLGKNAVQRARNSFRAAFIVLTAFDIFMGIERGFGGGEYLQTITFDFVGALLLGAFANFFIARVCPIQRQQESDAAMESAV